MLKVMTDMDYESQDCQSQHRRALGVLPDFHSGYAQAYRNRPLSFQRERSRIAFAHSVRSVTFVFEWWKRYETPAKRAEDVSLT